MSVVNLLIVSYRAIFYYLKIDLLNVKRFRYEPNLPKNTTGVVVMEILEGSPLMLVAENDIIVELQKKNIKNSKQFLNLVKEAINKNENTLYLAIYNSKNQRSYLTVKLK